MTRIRLRYKTLFFSCVILLFVICGCASNYRAICGSKNLFTGYPTFSKKDGIVNCIIEIPAGDNEKWAVNPKTGRLEIEVRHGLPRIVSYAVVYPANYGMIPQTRVSEEIGGDGDPVDIVVFGKRLKRASLQRARVLGVLHMLDAGFVDNKILAVVDNDDTFEDIKTLDEFKASFPQALDIIKIWFSNYKLGRVKVELGDFFGKEEALQFINASHQDYLSKRINNSRVRSKSGKN
jgi:inorganic pyrophosphatase